MKISSKIGFGCRLNPVAQNVIKAEPMLHRATIDFAYENGGPLTTEFLDKLSWSSEDNWEDVLIDSRVHMLMPGMYPCIPGWHHDDVPRSRSDGQPNYENPEYKSEHCLALWGDCCLTEFALGTHEVVIPEIGKKIYKGLSPVVEAACDSGELTRYVVPECQMIFFDWLSWHRGTEATKKGFRFFIRATRRSGLKARNQMRQNANVYMPVLDEGW